RQRRTPLFPYTTLFRSVELMRQGKSPQQACEEAVKRTVRIAKARKKDLKNIQVGFLALNKAGEHGAFCVQPGFNYALHDTSGNTDRKSTRLNSSHVKIS